jgi:DNA invertase Pin-like site-specific DNA recombinase
MGTAEPAQRPLRVALYARVSTRDKDQDPQLQLQPMREYVAARHWTVIEYVDRAPAADLADRKAWARLLEDVRRRRVDHILTWKLDRPFRSTLHCLRTLEEFAHRGVGFACLTQDIDTTSPTGRLLVTILAAVAEFERGLIAERVREGMANARRKGVRLGRPPAAARPHVAREWPTVRAQLAAGTLSKRAAARHLKVGLATLERLLTATPPMAAPPLTPLASTAPPPKRRVRTVPKREVAAAPASPG